MELQTGESTLNGAATDTPRGSIVDRAICLSVELRRLGTRRKVASTDVQTDADSEMIHVSKDILESETLDKIKRLDSEIREYVTRKTVPGMSLFRAGVYLVPISSLETIDEHLEEVKAVRAGYVDNFLAEYRDAANDARRRLGSLYNEDDYPSSDKVRAAFSMETKYVGFSTPDKLATISEELYRRESRKMQAAIQSATDSVVQGLRGEAAELVNHLVDRLSGKPGEKPKVFRDSLIDNVKTWLAEFSDRNSIAQDYGLATLADQMRQLVSGINPETLRNSDTARERMAEGFAQIKTQLDSMIVERPTRKVKFDS